MSCRVMSRMTSRRCPALRRSWLRRSAARRSCGADPPSVLRRSTPVPRRFGCFRRSPLPCPVMLFALGSARPWRPPPRRLDSARRARSSRRSRSSLAPSLARDLLEDGRDDVGDLLEEHLVAPLERAVALVERLDHADGAALLAPYRDDERVVRAIAGAFVDVAIESRVGIRVGHVDRLAGERSLSREARADGHSDLGGHPLGHSSPDLVLRAVDDVHRRALGVDRLRAEIDEAFEVGLAVTLDAQVTELYLNERDLVVEHVVSDTPPPPPS